MPITSSAGSRFGVRKESEDVHIAYRYQSLADHRPQRRQERLDALGQVDNLDVHGQVLAQFEQARGVQVTAGPVALDAANNGSAGNAPLLA